MARCFFERLHNKPKLIKCTRNISGAGEALVPAGECFIQLQIGKKTFRDRVIVIENLKCDYILGQVLHRTNRFSMGYLTTGRHYITINDEMIVQAISQTTNSPILKTKGKITLTAMSVSIVGIKMPTLQNSNNMYALNFDTFQLPEGVISLGVLPRINHKTPQSLSISILNTNNVFCSISKNSPIAMLALSGKCKEVQEVSWSRLQCDTANLLPKKH